MEPGGKCRIDKWFFPTDCSALAVGRPALSRVKGPLGGQHRFRYRPIKRFGGPTQI